MRVAVPARTAAMASSTVSRPRSRARWLSVPAGTATNGTSRSAAIVATAARVPSPPAAPMATSSSWHSRSSRSSSGSSSWMSAPGRPSRSASVGASVHAGPDDGFTTMRTPVPSGAGRSSGSGIRRGIGSGASAGRAGSTTRRTHTAATAAAAAAVNHEPACLSSHAAAVLPRSATVRASPDRRREISRRPVDRGRLRSSRW